MGIRSINGRLYIRFQVFGKPYNINPDLDDTPANRKRAKELVVLERKERRQALRRTRGEITPRSLRHAVDAYIASLRRLGVPGRESVNNYRGQLKSCLRFFGDVMLQDIEASDLQRYLEHRPELHLRTKVKAIRTLSRCFEYARRMRWTDWNPVTQVDVPRCRRGRRVDVLSADEERRYFSQPLHPQLHDFSRILLLQGLRPSELLGLRWCDVDFMKNELYVREGKSEMARRRLRLEPETRNILLRRSSNGSRWVFPSVRSPRKRLNYKVIASLHEAARQAAGLHALATGGKFDLYVFRHTFATRWAERGLDPYTLQALLGHESLEMTRWYLHLGGASVRAALDRFDAMERMSSSFDPHSNS